MPFLQEDIVDTTRSHVRPLYQHLMTQEYGPSLSFIGLPFKIIPFPQFELQCKYVARMLSGRVEAPASEEMEAWIHAHYKFAEQTGMEDRHLHLQSDAQWDYKYAPHSFLASCCTVHLRDAQSSMLKPKDYVLCFVAVLNTCEDKCNRNVVVTMWVR